LKVIEMARKCNDNQKKDSEDLRKKFHLLEGDRKVFYHASSMAKQRNRDQIQQLQKENKELRE